MTTESPRAAVLSDSDLAVIAFKILDTQQDRFQRMRDLVPVGAELRPFTIDFARAIIKADREARTVDEGSEPLTFTQWACREGMDPASLAWRYAEAAWKEAAARSAPAADAPDCDTCAHAALKESQEPCASCVPYAPARPMWTPKATAPAAAGAAPQAMPAEAQPCDQCGLIVPWCRRRDCRRFDAYTKMKRMRDLVALEDQCGGVFAAGALAATQPAGETQGADDVRVLLRECANMLEAKERERDLPKRERYVGNSAHYVTALVTRARAALARPAAGAGEGLTDTQRLDTLESEREVAGWLESSGWLIDAIGIPDCRGKTLREAIDAVHAARSTRTAQGGQE